VIVVSASVPFSRDPTRSLAAALADALRDDGRPVEWIDLPTSELPEDAADQRAAIEALDVGAGCGTLVCLGHPAFLLTHANSRVWLTGGLPPLDPDELAKLRSASRLFAPSGPVAIELSRAHGLRASALDLHAHPAEAARRLMA
jgi:hypothetical protein